MKMRRILLISFIMILINISNPIFARYYEHIEKIEGKAHIAEPIINVESMQETIIQEVNKKTVIKEYYFSVKNYKIDENGKKKTSEVDFLYDLEIINQNDNFPIKCELYDIDTNQELLDGKTKISGIEINKMNNVEQKYKLVCKWNSKENMSAFNNIDINLNFSQKKN